MPEKGKTPSRLRVALLETEPIRVQGFVTLFQDHPRIEFQVFELAAFLAESEFKLALIGLHSWAAAGCEADRHGPAGR
jgi:hypothetical protein